MNAKEYLLEIKLNRRKINILQAEIERLRTDAESVSISLDGMPKGSGKTSKWENIVIQLAECEEQLMQRLSEFWSQHLRAIELISKLKPKHQMILTEYYIADKTWESIAYEQGITWRSVYRLRDRALIEFEKILENN